jgi:hypothetical protein
MVENLRCAGEKIILERNKKTENQPSVKLHFSLNPRKLPNNNKDKSASNPEVGS